MCKQERAADGTWCAIDWAGSRVSRLCLLLKGEEKETQTLLRGHSKKNSFALKEPEALFPVTNNIHFIEYCGLKPTELDKIKENRSSPPLLGGNP